MKHETTSGGPHESTCYGTVACIVVCFICLSVAPALIKPSAGERHASPERQGEEDASLLCRVEVKAPMPYLRCDTAASQFQRLRHAVVAGAGYDFLATCGDLMRARTARSSKPGVAQNSKHKSGEAFDYNQEDGRVLVVREPVGGRTYWRTYLLCEKQDGGCGTKLDLETENAGRVSAYLFDFTAAAESLGWERIPAQDGWERAATKKEFWHYELKESAETAAGEGAGQEKRPSLLAAPFLYLADLISPRKPES